MANCVQCGRKLPALMFGRKLCQWCVQHEAAQRGQGSEDAVQRVEAAPWLRSQSSSRAVTQTIFGINVAVFIAMALAGVSLIDPTIGQLRQWGANFGPLTMGGQWWRLLTCVFLHIGIIHIGFNMWCLWDLGALAESLYGHWTFAAVYLITGIAASVTSIAWDPVRTSAGASGAIFGIAGALIASFYLGEFSLSRVAISGTLRSLLMFAGYNLVFGALSGRTDNAAHVGGLVSGLILGALIARVAPGRDEPLPRIGVLLAGALLVFGSVLWLQHSRGYVAHLANGSSLLAQNKTEEAIAELEKAVRERPGYVPARLEVAQVYARKGDLRNAETELKRVVELDPRNEAAYYMLGFVYLEGQRPAQAREAFTHLLAIKPNSADAHFGLAETYAMEKNDPEALREYKRTAELDPEYQNLFYDMGVTQARLRLYDDAIASFLKQREKGDDPDNENALASTYEAKGMKPEAEEARQKAAGFQGPH